MAVLGRDVRNGAKLGRGREAFPWRKRKKKNDLFFLIQKVCCAA